MKITIVPDDNLIIKDGEALKFDFSLSDPAIHAVQWDTDKGEIEFRDGRPNQEISSLDDFSSQLTGWETEKVNRLKATPPSHYHTWNNSTNAWEITADDDLKLARDIKKMEVKAARKLKVDAGFNWNGQHLDTDSKTRAALHTAYTQIQRDSARTYDWEKSDGSFITIDSSNVHAVMDAVDSYVQPIFSAAKAACDAIDELITKQEVEDYVISL